MQKRVACVFIVYFLANARGCGGFSWMKESIHSRENGVKGKEYT
jgi:hypothetical protein